MKFAEDYSHHNGRDQWVQRGHVLVAVPFVLTSILRGFLLRRFFNWVDSRCAP